MKDFIRKNLVVILMLASFIGISVAHTFIMTEMGTSQACFGVVVGNNCPLGSEGSSSTASHITVMQNLLQILPAQLGKILVSLFTVVFLLGSLLFLLQKDGAGSLLARRGRYRLLWLAISNFRSKIGSWLTLLEKRDPAHSVLWCGFKFAPIPIK